MSYKLLENLPGIHFGQVEDIDWKKVKEDTYDDNDADDDMPTPDYVKKILGFDPDEEFKKKRKKKFKRKNSLKI